MIDDDVLRSMSSDERAALRERLAALDGHQVGTRTPPTDAADPADVLAAAPGLIPTSPVIDRRRRRFATLMTLAALALVPWIVQLGLTLPRRHVAAHWAFTWVGFDAILLVSLALTSWLAWRRRQTVVLSAFASGTLLVCDAWFDITTSSDRSQAIVAVGAALLLELPLATTLFVVSSKVFARAWLARSVHPHHDAAAAAVTHEVASARKSST